MKHRINIIHADDWEGVYVDDTLAYQDHLIRPMELYLQLKYLIPGSTKLNDIVFDEWWVDEKWMSEIETLPENFVDVKLRY